MLTASKVRSGCPEESGSRPESARPAKLPLEVLPFKTAQLGVLHAQAAQVRGRHTAGCRL